MKDFGRRTTWTAAVVTSILAMRCAPSTGDHRTSSSEIEAAPEALHGTTCKGLKRLFSGSIRGHVAQDADRLYWLHEPAAAGALPRLESTTKDGSAPQIYDLTFESSTASLGGVDDAHLYFIDGRKVVRIAKTALAAVSPEREMVYEAKSEGETPLELRLDGSVLYLLAGAPKSVLLALPTKGGEPRELLSKLTNPRGLTLVGDEVFLLSDPDGIMTRAPRASTGAIPVDVPAIVPIDDFGAYGPEDNILAGGGIVYRYGRDGDEAIIKVPSPYGIHDLFLNKDQIFFTLVEANKPDTTLRASIRSASRFGFHDEGKELAKGLRQPTSIFFDEQFVYFTEQNPGGGGLFQAPRALVGTAPVTCELTPDPTLDSFGVAPDAGVPAATEADAGLLDASIDVGPAPHSGVDDTRAHDETNDEPETPKKTPTAKESDGAGGAYAYPPASSMCSSIATGSRCSNGLTAAVGICLTIALARRRRQRRGR